MIKVYGKNNCPKCVEIKSKLENMNIDFEYIQDDKLTMDKALELRSNGKLIEMNAPIIIKNDEQIKHANIGDLI